MAYKFQVGAATMVGSLTQEGAISCETSLTIGSAAMSEADLEKIDGITNGTAAANKAVVLDGSKNIATIGTIGCGAITSTGASSMGSLNVGGTLACDTSFTIDSTVISAAEIGVLDSVTAGTVAASKALVADANTLVKFADGSLNGIMGAGDTDNAIQMGASQDASIYYDGAGMDTLMLAVANDGGVTVMNAAEGGNGVLNIVADQHDDAGDMWEVACQASNDKFTIGNDIASKGTIVEHFSITPHATVANSTAAFAGNVTVAGDLTVTGTTTTVDTVTMEAANAVVFEGATADAHETTLTIIDPTGDRTIKLPNQSGCLPVLAADSDVAISSTPAELNLLDGDAKSTSSITIDPADAFIVIDGNTTKQIPASDITNFVAGATFAVGSGNVALKDNTNELAPGYNYFADLGGAESCNLPSGPAVGDIIHLKAPSNCSTSNTLTVNRQGSDTIDGANSIVLESPHAAVTFVCVAANTYKIF